MRTVESVDRRQKVSRPSRENRSAMRLDRSTHHKSREAPSVRPPDRCTCPEARSRGSNSPEGTAHASGRDRDAWKRRVHVRSALRSAEPPPAHGNRALPPTDAPCSMHAERASTATSPGKGSRRPIEDAGAGEMLPLNKQISQVTISTQIDTQAQSVPSILARKRAKTSGTARRT